MARVLTVVTWLSTLKPPIITWQPSYKGQITGVNTSQLSKFANFECKTSKPFSDTDRTDLLNNLAVTQPLNFQNVIFCSFWSIDSGSFQWNPVKAIICVLKNEKTRNMFTRLKIEEVSTENYNQHLDCKEETKRKLVKNNRMNIF